MRALTGISLLAVLLLVTLSAYLRLSHSGIGCGDWPACYGRIGEAQTVSRVISSENAYQRILAEASQPLAWATPLHRLVASVLGLLIFVLVILSFKRKHHRAGSLALLAITVFLALIGLKSGGLHSPAVVMGNLAGGFLMLGLLGWMMFTTGGPGAGARAANRPIPRGLLGLTLLILVGQILMGGLTSANFAATACVTLPDCHGSWLPGAELWRALDLSRVHEVTSAGQAIGGGERLAIHKAHRLGAVATLLMCLVSGFMAWRSGGRLQVAGLVLLSLAALEFAIGVASVVSGLPIALAVAHNWLAALLLLGLLAIVALNRRVVSQDTRP